MGVFSRRAERTENNTLAAVPFSEPRSLVAAAVRVNISEKKQVDALSARRVEDKWQDDAWEYYDLIGEVGFSARLIASVTSRVRLFPAYIEDEENEPVHVRSVTDIPQDLAKAASSAIRLLGTGNGGIPGLLRDAALNLFVTGECYLVREEADIMTGKPETWQIRSTSEIVVEQSGRTQNVAIKPRRNAKPSEYIKLSKKNAFIGRIWRMHPRYSDEADSSLKGLLELMDELLLLNKNSRSNLKKRLNAGLLYIPDEISNISQSDGDVDDSTDTYAELSDDNSASFEEELIEAMTTPISDEGSASSVVPLLIRGPSELGDKIRHIELGDMADPAHLERADKVLDRILAGLDIPKDVVAGIGDAKYANAVVIEETLFKSHVEPLVLMIVDALTVVFLRPVLKAMGFDEDLVNNLVVWYDPSPITAKPSKAEAANIGYDKGVLSATSWRRENGFAESDAPTEAEVGSRIVVERGLLSEPVSEALFRHLIPSIMDSVRTQAQSLSPSGADLDEVIESNQATETEAPTPPTQLLEPN